MQIIGDPPKWCDWITINKIASSLGSCVRWIGKLYFQAFFSVSRVKINYKDPKIIPEKRIMEMEDLLFMIQFIVEDIEQFAEKTTGDEGKGDDSDDEDLLGDKLEGSHEAEKDGTQDKDDKGRDKIGGNKHSNGKERTPNSKQGSSQRINSVRRDLFLITKEILNYPVVLIYYKSWR